MRIIVPVKVKYSIDSYKARIFKISASCTSDARTAVKRTAEKYIKGSNLSIFDIKEIDSTSFELTLERPDL